MLASKPELRLPLRMPTILSRPTKAPPQMKRMLRGVDLDEFLLRVLAATLGRNIRDRAFDDFQQRLLHAFTADVASDRRVFALAGDLIDFVDVDDALLRALDVVVAALEEIQDDVFDVFADVTGFGQRRRIRHGERHIEDLGERLSEQGLAGAGRADQQDVALLELDRPSLARLLVA